MKQNREFSKVFELCLFVMKQSKSNDLLLETFKTLAQFLRLKWIPTNVIFESSMIEGLALQFYDLKPLRINVLEILVEIGGIKLPPNSQSYQDKLAHMFLRVLKSTIGKYGVSEKTNFDELLASSEANR
ncbi:exportin, partial [Reticulomyxa filosa]